MSSNTNELAPFIHTGLTHLQELCGSTAASKGFHDDRPLNKTLHQKAALRDWQGNKLLLIVSEIVEAHDEIRTGHPADETYYPSIEWDDETFERKPNKPEGVPSEIADAVIRCFDFAYTEGFSLADIIAEKLAYNATREYMHGKKF